jgi:hypothetical protein
MMHGTTRFAPVVLALTGGACGVLGQTPETARPIRFQITLARELGDTPQTGRLIVLMTSRPGMREEIKPILADTSVWLSAKEVRNWKAGAIMELDPDELAFPAPWSQAPAGDYRVMAVLDVNHHYSYTGGYGGRNPGDLRSSVKSVQQLNPRRTAPIDLILGQRTPELPITLPPGNELIDFVSPMLTKFWGRPIHVRGVVRLPDGYASSTSPYPTAYYIPGFGADMGAISAFLNSPAGRPSPTPDLITVILDHSGPWGNHNFTDSVNNGPWATALTTEVIPYLQSKYRMDPDGRRRFLTGFSSGAGAALSLQVNYPQLFGGAWPLAGIPADFRDIFGVNLHATPLPNLYRDGEKWAGLLARQGRVLGEYGGHISSLDWIYSPRGDDGRAMPLFDRETGDTDPEVARAWLRYEIADIIRNNADRLRLLLDHKIHVTVGTKDLGINSARFFEQTLKSAKIQADFTYVEGRDHNAIGNDATIMGRVFQEMAAVARAAK